MGRDKGIQIGEGEIEKTLSMKESPESSFKSTVLGVCGAREILGEEKIQALWSGYGSLSKVTLDSSANKTSVVVKHVRFPDVAGHPRGWSGERSHRRKARSYEVEFEWYRSWSRKCRDGCRVPEFLAEDRDGEELLLVMEDLDAAGFPVRVKKATMKQVGLGLRWLAEFHASFLGQDPAGLWPVGTYWHLETRPDELGALEDDSLRKAAPEIDARLRGAKYQTLVHGDAKLANFCFSENGGGIAAVDFQYVGGGCGMKDVAYFLGSCLDEQTCEEKEEELLEVYFGFLRSALRRSTRANADELISEWRDLYHFAWADFHRFLKGWCPGHWKINSYSERLVREVVARL